MGSGSTPLQGRGLRRLPSVCGRAPEEPAGRPSLRTISLARDEFEKQAASTSSLWRVSINARAGGEGSAPRYAAVSTQEEAPHAAGSSPAAGSVAVQLEAPLQRLKSADAPRSVFGLPILSCRSPLYLRWSLLILLIDLTYSTWLLPISIGFQVSDLDWSWACIVDLVAGAFFAAELALGFHTSYCVSNAGQTREVRGGRAVGRYYMLHGSFLQDLLSTAVWLTQIILLLVHQAGGVPLAESSSAFQYVRIVRLLRFASVLKQLLVLTVGSGRGSLVPGLRFPPTLAHALNIFFSSLVLVNFFACLWNFIAIMEDFHGTWLNPVAALVRRYGADGESVLTPQELAAIPGWHRWVTGCYFTVVTVATLGYGDVVPQTTLEMLVDCGVIAIGVLMFGLAMGSLAEVVANSSKEARQAQLFRDKMESVNAWLHASALPKGLKQRIRAYYSDVWVRHAASQANASERFLELPHALRQEVAWEANRRLLGRLSLFRELDEEQRFALSSALVPLDLTPGQELCLHGDPADRLYLLHDGEVQLFDECEVVAVVAAPAVLGVEALLQHVEPGCAARPFGYRTGAACTVWEAELEDLMPYLLENPGVLDALCCRAQRQREDLAATIAVNRAAAEAVAGGTFGLDPAPPQPPAGGWPQPGEAAAAEAGGGAQAGDSGSVDGSGAGGACLWTVSSAGVSANPSATQLPAAAAAAGENAVGAAEPAPDNAVADGPSGPVAGGAAAATPDGQVDRLRTELVSKLEALTSEMRRALAAASLAQSVALRATHAHGGHQRGGGSQRASSGGGASPAKRRHWSYGQFTAL